MGLETIGIGSLVGGAISGGASLIGAGKSASAAKEAAQIQADASNYAADKQSAATADALDLTKSIYDKNVLRAQPFVDAGTTGVSNLSAAAGYMGAPLNSTVTNRVGNIQLAVPDLLGSFDTYAKNRTADLDVTSPNRILGVDAKSPLPSNPTFAPTMENLEKTPGYKFILDQGLKAVQNSYAAQGLGTSGAAMKGAADYAEGLASTTYQNQFKNWYDEQNLALDNYNKQTVNLLQQAGAASKFDLSQNQLRLDQASTSQNFDARQVDQRLAATNDAENFYLKRYDQQLDQAKVAQDFDLANNKQQYSMLYDLSALGANSAAGLGTQGSSLANTASNSLISGTNASNQYSTSGAAATAAGTVGASNAYTGALGSIGNTSLLGGLLYDNKNSNNNSNIDYGPDDFGGGSNDNSLFSGLFNWT